jgi:hypothetical protein
MLMKMYRILIVVLLALALGACGNATPNGEDALPSGNASGTASTNTPSSAPVEQFSNLPYTTTPSLISTATMSSTPRHPKIVVTAVKGNVFIRRGPDLAYNAVSVLMDGQSAEALTRDVLGKWLQISIPGHPKETGWISIQTRFVTVSGDIMKLPEVMPTDWPVLASLRNCTYHYMEANPGGIVIPSVYNFPDNDVQINPGVYTIHDIEVDGSPEVMQVEIKEGAEIDIRDDGDGDHKKCVSPYE